MIGGVSFSETLATALGIPFVVGYAQGISRARYYPDVQAGQGQAARRARAPAPHRRPDGRRRGHQGARRLPGHGRADRASRSHDLATMENVYTPAHRRAQRAHRAGRPERAGEAAGGVTRACVRWLAAANVRALPDDRRAGQGRRHARCARRPRPPRAPRRSSGAASSCRSSTGCPDGCATRSSRGCRAATGRPGGHRRHPEGPRSDLRGPSRSHSHDTHRRSRMSTKTVYRRRRRQEGDVNCATPSEKVFEDIQAERGQKATVFIHSVPFEGSVALVNLLTSTRLVRKGFKRHDRALRAGRAAGRGRPRLPGRRHRGLPGQPRGQQPAQDPHGGGRDDLRLPLRHGRALRHARGRPDPGRQGRSTRSTSWTPR